MDAREIKFHEIHGLNIHLSTEGSEALLVGSCNGLCFTSRPLEFMETINLKVDIASSVQGGDIRFGLTRYDPYELQGRLPRQLRDAQHGDFYLGGRTLLSENSRLRFEEEIIIGNSPSLGPIIRNTSGIWRKLHTGITANQSVDSFYLIFDLFVNTTRISIMAVNRFFVPLTISPPLPESKSRSFPNYILKVAEFRPSSRSDLQVMGQIAVSLDTTACVDTFVIVGPSLGANSTLIVELTALKRIAPVRIILSDVNSDRFGYSRAGDFTRFFVIESEMPTAREELALRISETGLVSVNHGNRGWSSRLTANPALRYNVLIDMQNVSVLYLVGITTGEERVLPSTGIVPSNSTTAVTCSLPQCIVCLGYPRAIILMPCLHAWICDICLERLAEHGSFMCPVCHVVVDKAAVASVHNFRGIRERNGEP